MEFKKWALGFSGCDRGDIGSKQQRSIWLCGIEWGGGHDAESLVESISFDHSLPPQGYDKWEDNLAYIFNWRAMKLLATIDNYEVSSYKNFAKNIKPFVIGSTGFFKMNLYPIAFKNTSFEHWKSEFSKITSLNGKSEYLTWCEQHRFPVMREWVSKYQPKLINCLGISYKKEFTKAFLDSESHIYNEKIEGKEFFWGINRNNTLVIIIPFMVNRYGLTRDSSIQKFGNRISELLKLNCN
jgi:hypothetical protein